MALTKRIVPTAISCGDFALNVPARGRPAARAGAAVGTGRRWRYEHAKEDADYRRRGGWGDPGALPGLRGGERGADRDGRAANLNPQTDGHDGCRSAVHPNSAHHALTDDQHATAHGHVGPTDRDDSSANDGCRGTGRRPDRDAAADQYPPAANRDSPALVHTTRANGYERARGTGCSIRWLGTGR